MSRLLRGVFCVIETFHKYAREDGDPKAKLTRRELRQLLEREIRNFLQPHVFHAVERKLNLLDIDRDGAISFEEFLLAIFSLLNLFYFDMSSLNPEPRPMSESEKMDDVDLLATTRRSQQVVGVGPTQERLVFASSAQPSHEEGQAGEHSKTSPREDIKTHNLPRKVSEPSDPENQHPEEDDQEVAQDVPATEYDGVQFKRNTPGEVSKQSSNPTQVIPKESGKAVRSQRDTKLSDHMAQRPSEDEKRAIEKSIKKHSTTQDPFPQKEDRAMLEHTDLPIEVAAGKPSHTQEVIELMDDTRISETQEPEKDAGRTPPETTHSEDTKADRTSETHELPAQERKHETQNQSALSGSRNDSETSSRGKWEEGRKDHERKTEPPAPEAQTQGEKCQEVSGSWRGKGAEKGSGTQGLSSEEGNQNLPENKEEPTSGKEARHSEGDTEDTFLISKNSPAAEETLGTRESSQELAPLEKQSQGKNQRATRTPDKPVRKQDHSAGEDPEVAVPPSGEGSCETPSSLAPEVGSSSSDSGELQAPGDLQSQVDTHGDAKQGSDNNNSDPQKQGAPGESSRVQEAVVVSIQEDRQLPEEEEQPARGEQGGPGAAVEPSEGGEVQESTAGGENRKSPEAESSGAQ
ncbi:trichohyalin-like protein 1 [Peromyscus californicus insignis]|uniref:trichohyalin-like protein 1 n=1 Tax=Peromyscus californicus insignis TaxID=564181 RepID=UPI0022A726C8|nr:trichohyalin-like protein 1 [Peromyscus californicus insignis]